MPQTEDLYTFLIVVKNRSFIKAANELGVSRAYISKRIQILEEALGYQLLYRTTRVIELTEQGERAHRWAEEILLNLQQLEEELTQNNEDPEGHLSITSSLGFGRQYIAPLLSKFTQQHPKITIRFDTIDRVQDLIAQHVDLDIHIGNQIAPNLIAKKLAPNQRILCASPHYLKERGVPKKLEALLEHNCLIIQERDAPYAIWSLNSRKGEQKIRVSGNLSSNNGELVKAWALDGQGVMLRSLWDIQKELKEGRLVRILEEYWQDADIWAIYPIRLNHSAKMRSCVNFLAAELPKILELT